MSMGVSAKVDQLAKLSQDFSQMSREGRLRILNETQRIALWLVGYIKRDKLQGQVLHHRSGNLSTRVTQQTEVHNDTIVANVGVFSGVPYARIHEYGFNGEQRVRQHTRVMSQAWGKDIEPVTVEVKSFSRNVNMPERSYLRSSLADKRTEILARLSKVAANLRGGT